MNRISVLEEGESQFKDLDNIIKNITSFVKLLYYEDLAQPSLEFHFIGEYQADWLERVSRG